MGTDPVICCTIHFLDTHHVVNYSTQRETGTKNVPPACCRARPLTDCVRVAVIVQASSGYRLAAKQRITLKAVTELFQEPEHIGDAADRGQSQGVLLLVKIC